MMLITPSLLSSFAYYLTYDGEEQEAQRSEFLRMLRRERSEPNEAMQKGIDFENVIKIYCDRGDVCNEDGISQVSDVVSSIGEICKGGIWQQAVKTELDGYLLYGKTDVIKRDTIIDIKRTDSYDIGKYQLSMQHRIYLYCTKLPRFSCLISNERDWWREDYFNHERVEQEIRDAIREFTGYLENDPEAKTIYYDKWKSYER